MTDDTATAATLTGALAEDRLRGRTLTIALAGILALAALNFFWQLGSSSYFLDEVFSIQRSLPPLHRVLTIVSHTENTPWTYFVLFHVWLHITGSQAEWLMRLPSALAGVALVGAVYWMARAFLPRAPSLGAAALSAVSPLVLEYAQQARVYVFAMLAVTLAYGATLRGARDPSRGWLLVAGAAAAVVALWLHYTATFVVFPLCLWLVWRRELPRRTRAAFVAVCALADVIVFPLFVYERHHAPAALVAGSKLEQVVRVAMTPFDGRWVAGVDAERVLAVCVVAAAVLVVLIATRVAARRLLVAAGVLPPLALYVIALLGSDAMISRYASVSAPFLFTAVAAAATALPRAAAAALAVAALCVCVVGLVDSHRKSGFYPPARETVEYIRGSEQPRDAIAAPASPVQGIPLSYYVSRTLRSAPRFFWTIDRAGLDAAAREHRRIWIIDLLDHGAAPSTQLLAGANRFLRPWRYRALNVRVISTSETFATFLAVPRSP